MKEISAWPDVHDATFQSLLFRWDIGRIDIKIEIGGENEGIWLLSAEDVRALLCHREQPWGPSISINEMRGPAELGSGWKRVEIEIQSGDVISIEAKDFGFVFSG